MRLRQAILKHLNLHNSVYVTSYTKVLSYKDYFNLTSHELSCTCVKCHRLKNDCLFARAGQKAVKFNNGEKGDEK